MPKPAIREHTLQMELRLAFQAGNTRFKRFQSLQFKTSTVPQWEMSSPAVGCSWLGIAESSSPFAQPSEARLDRITYDHFSHKA